MTRFLKRCYLGLIMIFLYVPIVVLIVQSFNAGESRANWEGFSLHWYGELLRDERILNALYVTVSIAVIAMVFIEFSRSAAPAPRPIISEVGMVSVRLTMSLDIST